MTDSNAKPNRRKVVLSDHKYPIFDFQPLMLAAVGADLVDGQARTEDALIELCRDADAIMTGMGPYTRRVIEQLSRCKIIVRYGVGYDNIDVPAATRRGIMVANVPDYCVEEVSDHVVGLLLACARRIVLSNNIVKRDGWSKFQPTAPCPRLRGQTLGIVGFGRIGQAVAAKAGQLGLGILAHDPYLRADVVRARGAVPVQLEELLAEADYVTLHLPLTADTTGLFGQSMLPKMKPTAFLINAARGALVDQPALYRALVEGVIAGAALDVLVKEPPAAEEPLFTLDNVIVTPHIAWYSDEAIVDLYRKGTEAVVRALKGQRPTGLVNPEVLLQE